MKNNKFRKNFKYIKIRNMYINLEHNFWNLFFILFLKSKPFLNNKSNKNKIKFIPIFFLKIYRIFRIIIEFTIKKYILKPSVLKLPFYGNIVLYRKNKNYKIFDLEKEIVITFLKQPGLSRESINKMINQIIQLNDFKFSPSIIDYNVKEKWYKEEYLNLPHINNNWNEFLPSSIKLIKQIILFYPIKTINLKRYIKKLNYIFEKDKLNRNKKVEKIKKFNRKLSEKLLNLNNIEIPIAYTHGDIAPVNMFYKNEDIIAIDWEGSKYRHFLYDIYDTVIRATIELEYPDGPKINELDNIINSSINNIHKIIKKEDITKHRILLNNNNLEEKFQRWLFYIEFINRRLEYILLTINAEEEMINKRLNSILKWINIFKKIEDKLYSEE